MIVDMFRIENFNKLLGIIFDLTHRAEKGHLDLSYSLAFGDLD